MVWGITAYLQGEWRGGSGTFEEDNGRGVGFLTNQLRKEKFYGRKRRAKILVLPFTVVRFTVGADYSQVAYYLDCKLYRK
jgi:hypothetical protein